MKIILRYWPLIAVLLFGFVLRVYRIDELFHFTYDESVPAFVGRRLILWHHVPLIGGVTPFNFHLGPYFYWFYSFLLFLGDLNPVIWGWASASIATLTSFLMYKAGSIFFSRKVGVIAACLWAFSYLANIYDRHLWALYWGPLVSLLVLIALTQIIKGRERFVYLLGLTLALAIHADPSNFIFVVISVFAWKVFKLPLKKSTFIALGLILFSFLPLIIFDLRHNFANTRPVLDFWVAGRNNPGFKFEKFINNSLLFPRAFSRLIYTFGDTEIAKQYSYCSNFVYEKYQGIPWYVLFISSITILVSGVWGLKNKLKNKGLFLMSLMIVLYFIGIQLYGTVFGANIFEHYITGLFPIYLLIAALTISRLPKKLLIGALALFITMNLFQLFDSANSMGFVNKRQAVEFVMNEVGERPFSLDSLSTCWKYSGYRYLFAVFGREPVKSYVDPNFAYLYGTTQVADKHPETVVSFVVHDFLPETDDFYRRYALLKSREIKNGVFGNIEVIIVDNSSGWFDNPSFF